jgi:NitT/TauT family transport system substrate-binding protein
MSRLPAWPGWGVRIALCSSLILVLSACGNREPLLRLVINEWPGFAYFHLAERNRYINESALRLRIHSFRDQVDQIRRYTQGEADALAVTLGDTLLICARVPARCPVIVFVIDESRGGDQLLGLPGYETLSSLRKQGIGLEDSVLARYLIHRIFERADMGQPLSSQLHFASQGSFDGLLQSGKVKAVLTYPPNSTLLQRKLDLRVVISTRSLPGEVLDVLAIAPEYLRRHPRAVAALIEGWRQARSQEQNSPDKVARTMASLMGIPEQELRAEQKGLLYPGLQEQYQLLSEGGGNLMGTLRREHTLLVRIGLIQPDSPLPSLDSRFIFPSPAE